MDNILEIFFLRDYEKKVNMKMMYYNYEFPYEEFYKYIEHLVNVPIADFLDYIFQELGEEGITAKDIFQFSNFEDCTVNLCNLLKSCNNPGVTHIDAGRLLLSDGKKRKDGAYTKYGENHLKTGLLLGLIFSITNTYFLSSIGMVYNEINENTRYKLLTRLILRNKLVIRMIRATRNGKVNMRQFLYMLSDSTFIRRRSNIKTILGILAESKEYDFHDLISNFDF